MKKNTIQIKSFAFALRIIDAGLDLQEKHQYVLANQILRSGTSIGANVEEAIGAYSKKDFTYKMNIALKEARETHYWLRLFDQSNIDLLKTEELLNDAKELVSILSAIVKTSKEKTESDT